MVQSNRIRPSERAVAPRATVTLVPESIGAVLAVVAVLLTLASLVTQVFHHLDLAGIRQAETLTRLLNVDEERSLPTWFSVVLLSLGSFLCAITGAVVHSLGQKARDWHMLSFLVLALSVDELVGVHERLGPLVQSLFGLSVYAWVVPAGLLGLILLPWLLRFLGRLPTKTRRLVVYAGLVYFGGALGIEALSGIYSAAFGEANIGYESISSAEELLEMLGIVLLSTALLDFLRSLGPIFVTGESGRLRI